MELDPPKFILNLNRMLLIAVIYGMDIRITIACAVVRTAIEILSPRGFQVLLPNTRRRYQSWIRSKARKNRDSIYSSRLVEDIQPLENENDSAILWLGNRRKATKVVYYFHGGGYFIPMNYGQVDMCWDVFVKQGVDSGVEVACAILQYSLAPGLKYPGHLRQALAGYNEIRAQGFKPSQIIVGGDSAGGNLTAQFLLHVRNPAPGVAPLKLEEPFVGAFLMSPFLTRNMEVESVKVNRYCDMIPGHTIPNLMYNLIDEADLEDYHAGRSTGALPLDDDHSHFKGLESIVKRMYVTVGSYETLADHGREFAKLVKKWSPGVEVLWDAGPKEPHVGAESEYLVRKPGPAVKRAKAWFKYFLHN